MKCAYMQSYDHIIFDTYKLYTYACMCQRFNALNYKFILYIACTTYVLYTHILYITYAHTPYHILYTIYIGSWKADPRKSLQNYALIGPVP